MLGVSLVIGIWNLGFAPASAQIPIPSGTGTVIVQGVPLQAVIDGPDDSAVGRTMILNASKSLMPDEGTVEYEWYVNDQQEPISRAVDAIYTPEKAGKITFRLVVRVRRNDTVTESEATHIVTAYSRKMVLVADPTLSETKMNFQRQLAEEAGIFLKILQLPDTSLNQSEEALATIFQNANDFRNADAIILWTDGIPALQALMQVTRDDPDRADAMHSQTIVVLSEQNLSTLARAANGPFTVLRPERIILTRPEALSPLLLSASAESFLLTLEERELEYVLLDEKTVAVRPWNVLSSLVNYMLVQGVSSQTIVLLLILPVIATIIAFLRQVVGITTFGLFAPSIVALSFLALGWWVGLLFLIFIIVTGYLTRAFMQRWHLLYIPKVAIILSVISVTLLGLLGIGAAFNVILSRDSVFILLILSTLGESFLTTKAEQGLKSAVFSVGQTILAALLCVLIVQWSSFQSIILAYPELILVTLIINPILGRWTGLRIVEYFRFREVFRHLYEE